MEQIYVQISESWDYGIHNIEEINTENLELR